MEVTASFRSRHHASTRLHHRRQCSPRRYAGRIYDLYLAYRFEFSRLAPFEPFVLACSQVCCAGSKLVSWLGKRLFSTHGSAGTMKLLKICTRAVLFRCARSRLQVSCSCFELDIVMTFFCSFSQVSKLKTENFKPKEQVTLEPYERDHAVVIAIYRDPKKTKNT